MSTVMTTELQKMEKLAQDGWRMLKPSSLRNVRRMLEMKHGGLKKARVALGVNAMNTFYSVLINRENFPRYISAIQRDLELTDAQVLALWPLLKEWPKKQRRAG